MSEHEGHAEIRIGSERSFGYVFAGVFALVGLFPLIGDGGVRWWSMAIAAGFLGVALARPIWLRGPNRLWFRFGLLLGRIVAPIVMGIIFFLTVTPIGLVMRLRRPDLLNQAIRPDLKSYWVRVDSDRAQASSMRRQF